MFAALGIGLLHGLDDAAGLQQAVQDVRSIERLAQLRGGEELGGLVFAPIDVPANQPFSRRTGRVIALRRPSHPVIPPDKHAQQQLRRLEIPQPKRLVVRAGEQEATIRADGHGPDDARVPDELVNFPAAGRVVQRQAELGADDDSPAAAAAGDEGVAADSVVLQVAFDAGQRAFAPAEGERVDRCLFGGESGGSEQPAAERLGFGERAGRCQSGEVEGPFERIVRREFGFAVRIPPSHRFSIGRKGNGEHGLARADDP